MPVANKKQKISKKQTIGTQTQWNTAPPKPPQKSQTRCVYLWIPFVVFSATFFLLLIHYAHTWLIENLKIETNRLSDLVEKAPFDRKAYLELMRILNELKKLLQDS